MKSEEGRARQACAWQAVFVVLAILATTGVILPIVYNLGQQLKPEHLDAARKLWREKGRLDYDLTYAVTYDKERHAERHIVLVREGKIVFASCEGEVLVMSPAIAAVVGLPLGGLGQDRERDVPALFDHIETLLNAEQSASRRNFMVAVFDPLEGYPRRFIWRVRGTKTREEWDVKLWPAGDLGQPGARARRR